MEYIIRKFKAGMLRVNVFLHKWIPSIVPSSYISFHLRPKKASNIETKSAQKIYNNEFSIVMQGPILNDDQFTLETIKLYKTIFPGACLILSTWENECNDDILLIKKEGVVLILNKKPENPGPYNVNMQLVTTINGIKKAESIGSKYVLKTRTDQRLHRHDLFDYFKNIQSVFPLKVNEQSQRLIVTSFATCKYRLYGVTDFLMFGSIEDMLNYWSTPLYEDGIRQIVPDYSGEVPIVSGVPIIAEIYIMISYCIKIGQPPEWNLQHYWSILKDYFCVVDGMTLDIYWNKYYKLREYRYTRDYADTNPRAMEFADWLYLYLHGKGPWENIREKELWEYKDNELFISKL